MNTIPNSYHPPRAMFYARRPRAERDMPTLIEPQSTPNVFPKHHRLSKAWRMHYLGRPSKWELPHILFVFVIDDKYGVCKLAVIKKHQIKRDARTGKVHFAFQTNYSKMRVVVYGMTKDLAPKTDAQIDQVFNGLHQSLISADPALEQACLFRCLVVSTRFNINLVRGQYELERAR